MNLFENLCLFNESDNSKAVKSKLIESNNSVYKDFSTTINNYESEINDGLRSGRLDRIDNTLEKLPIVINELENQLNLLNDEYQLLSKRIADNKALFDKAKKALNKLNDFIMAGNELTSELDKLGANTKSKDNIIKKYSNDQISYYKLSGLNKSKLLKAGYKETSSSNNDTKFTNNKYKITLGDDGYISIAKI